MKTIRKPSSLLWKIVLIVLALTFVTVAFAACADDKPQDTYVPNEPGDGGNKVPQDEHVRSAIISIDDDTHGVFCQVHDDYELVENHNWIRYNEFLPYYSYDNDLNDYVIKGSYNQKCSVCDKEGESVSYTYTDEDALSATEKATFVSSVKSYDYDSLEFVRMAVNVYSGAYSYRSEDGLWFGRNGSVDLTTTNVMNKLNKILDILVDDTFQLFKAQDRYSEKTLYLLKGTAVNPNAKYDSDLKKNIGVRIFFDETFRPTEIFYEGNSSFSSAVRFTYDAPTETSDIEDLNRAKAAADGKKETAYTAPSMPSFNAPTRYYHNYIYLEYYSPSESYRYTEYEKETDYSTNQPIYKYLCQRGVRGTQSDEVLYGIYDSGKIFYQIVDQENDNEAYLRDHKTQTTRSEFYNHVSLYTDLEDLLDSLAEYTCYKDVSTSDPTYCSYYFLADDENYHGVFRLNVKNDTFLSLYFYSENLPEQSGDDSLIFIFPDSLQSTFLYDYDDTLTLNDFEENFPEYLFSAWHTHRVSTTEYDYDGTYHWFKVLCGCDDAKVPVEHKAPIISFPDPYHDGSIEYDCECGYYHLTTLDSDDYDWTFGDTIYSNGPNICFKCIGTPKSGEGESYDVYLGTDNVNSTTQAAYLEAVNGATNPYHAFAVETYVSLNRTDLATYVEGNADYSAKLAELTVHDSTFFDDLSNEGYENIIFYEVTPVGHADNLLFYRVGVTDNDSILPSQVIYFNKKGLMVWKAIGSTNEEYFHYYVDEATMNQEEGIEE